MRKGHLEMATPNTPRVCTCNGKEYKALSSEQLQRIISEYRAGRYAADISKRSGIAIDDVKQAIIDYEKIAE